MLKPCCTEETTVSKVKIEEHGKKAVFINTAKEKIFKTKVDGCLILNSCACDYYIHSEKVGVLIELKGTDVKHALTQIEATFEKFNNENKLKERMAGLIVCRKPGSHPSFTTKVQKSKELLAKKYKAPLHIIAENREYTLNSLINFTTK